MAFMQPQQAGRNAVYDAVVADVLDHRLRKQQGTGHHTLELLRVVAESVQQRQAGGLLSALKFRDTDARKSSGVISEAVGHEIIYTFVTRPDFGKVVHRETRSQRNARHGRQGGVLDDLARRLHVDAVADRRDVVIAYVVLTADDLLILHVAVEFEAILQVLRNSLLRDTPAMQGRPPPARAPPPGPTAKAALCFSHLHSCCFPRKFAKPTNSQPQAKQEPLPRPPFSSLPQPKRPFRSFPDPRQRLPRPARRTWAG